MENSILNNSENGYYRDKKLLILLCTFVVIGLVFCHHFLLQLAKPLH